MAISSETSSLTFTGNNSTVTPYALTFPFSGASEIVVTHITSAGVRSVLAVTTGYTLAGTPSAGTGTLVTLAAVPVADTLLVERFTSAVQSLESDSPTGSYPTSIETQLDRTTRAVQDDRRVTSRNFARTLRVPDGETLTQLSAAADRAGRYPAFDDDGALILKSAATILSESGGAADGVGIPAGGTTGQILAKLSDIDFDSGWLPAGVLPNGAGITDPAAFREAVSAQVRAYAAATGIGWQGTLAWERFVSVLSAGGILDDLVDCFCPATGLNNPDSMVTLNLAAVTISGTPVAGPDGLQFVGTVADRAAFTIPNTPVFSLLVDSRNAADISGDAVHVQMANAAGLGTAGTLLYIASALGVIMTAQSGNYALSNSFGNSSSSFSVSSYNPCDQIVAITSDNGVSPTVKAYVNGFLVMTDAAGQNTTTSSVTRVTLGAFSVDAVTYELPYKGSIRTAAVFSRVLTAAEVIVATRAVRQLDLRDETFVCYGDSQTAQLGIALGSRYLGNWPLLFGNSPRIRSILRIENPAYDSMASDLALTVFPDIVPQFRPDGAGIQRATLVLAFGTNDIDDGATAATFYARLKALAVAGRELGYRVGVCTIMHNTYFSVGQETIRQDANALILADTTSWDWVWDWSSIVGTAHDVALWLDTLHLNNAGNKNLAGNLAAGGFPRLAAFS